MDLRGFLADGYLLCKINLKHYSKALMGVGLKLDPDYPIVTRFFPTLLRDSVLEWRVYGLIPLWGLIISLFPSMLVALLLLAWIYLSISRSKHFKTPLAFWKQAAGESPYKLRCQVKFCEELMRECERGLKAGQDVRLLEAEAFRVQDWIVRLSGPDGAARRRSGSSGRPGRF